METCPKKIPSGSWLTCHWQILPKIAPACKVLSTNKLVSFCNHLLILDDKNTFKHLFNTMHLNMHYWEKNYFQSNLDTKLHQKLTAGNRAKGPPIFVVFGEMNRLKPPKDPRDDDISTWMVDFYGTINPIRCQISCHQLWTCEALHSKSSIWNCKPGKSSEEQAEAMEWVNCGKFNDLM